MNTFTKREKSAYLIGVAGQNILYGVISAGLPYYYQSVIFLPAMAISIIFAVAKVIDAVKDPLMGTLIDRTYSKWGKCRPYLIFSPVFVCVATILTFLNGTYGSYESSKANFLIIIWAALSYFLWGVAFTFADVPLWTLPSLMTESAKDRNRILAQGRIAASVGAGIAVPLIVPAAQALSGLFSKAPDDSGIKGASIFVCIFLAALGSALFQLTGLMTKERVKSNTNEKFSFRENLHIISNCKPFKWLMISGIIRSPSMLFSLVQTTLFSYYYGDNGKTSYLLYLALIGGGNILGQFAANFLMPSFADKYDKKNLYFIMSVLNAVPFLLIFCMYLMAPGELSRPVYLLFFTVFMIIAGAGQGGISVLQSVMTADCVEYHQVRTGYRPDGVFFSGQTFLTKVSTGISSIISGVVYAVVGFSGDGVKLVNDALYSGASFKSDPLFAKYRFAIFFLICIPPAVSMLLSMIPMKKYSIADEDSNKN